MRDYESKLVDSSRKLADILVRDIADDPVRFREMMDIAARDEYPASMRAARIVALSSEIYPELVMPHIPKLLEKIQYLKTEGVLRGFLKIISEIPYPYNDEQLGLLADSAFTWLSDSRYPVAVRYYSVDILMMISKKYPDIGNELKNILLELYHEGSSGLKSKYTKVLQSLDKTR